MFSEKLKNVIWFEFLLYAMQNIEKLSGDTTYHYLFCAYVPI